MVGTEKVKEVKILVLADDLTGAAEIGGIARRSGLRADIAADPSVFPVDGSDVMVLDTHSRSCQPAESAAKLSGLLKGIDMRGFDLVYKKVDSVLRGPVATEAETLMRFTGKRNTLMIPANPSSGRTICNGHYFIDGIPLDQMFFRTDPEYPRLSSRIEELVTDQTGQVITTDNPLSTMDSVVNKLIIPSIASVEMLDELTQTLDPGQLQLAGGADFFASLIRHRFHLDLAAYDLRRAEAFNEERKEIFLLGSHPTVSGQSRDQFTGLGITVHAMASDPEFADPDSSRGAGWQKKLLHTLNQTGRLAISGPDQVVSTPEAGQITGILSDIAARIISELEDPLSLFIEGGELASELFRKLDWKKLEVKTVHGQGITGLQSSFNNHFAYIKPGSYSWPAGFLTSPRS